MKYLFTIIIAIVFLSCTDTREKTKNEMVHNDHFNWTISIPDGFVKQTTEESEAQQAKGAQMISDTYDQEIDYIANTIFSFKKDETNYFESNYQPFDTAVDGNYLTSCKEVNQIIYNTFLSQMEDVTMDSNSTTQLIDGIVFQQFNVIITFPNQMKLTTHMYSSLFDKEELTINIMYVNQESGDKMLESWLNSSFH